MVLVQIRITIFLLLGVLCQCVAQEIESKKNIFSIGAQTRITPIYQLKNPTSGTIPNSNLLTQADKHYSGPGIILSWQSKLNNNLEFSFSPCIRWDYLYDVVGFAGQQDPQYSFKTKNSFILDTYMDFKYLWQGERTRKSVGIGLALCGVGTGYIMNQIAVIDNNPYVISTREDFLFPAIYATAGLKFSNKLFCEIKMGYCWSNPDFIIKDKFFFPEIRVSYDLFDF